MTRYPTRGPARVAAASLLACAVLGACGGSGGDSDERAPREGTPRGATAPTTGDGPGEGPTPDPTPDPGTGPVAPTEPDPEPVLDNGSTLLDTTPIAEFLEPDAWKRVELNDGKTPIVEGSWLRPTVNDSWTWQLQGPLVDDYEVDWYVIDAFAPLGRDTMERLRAKGRNVLCYFSAGTYEPWRPDVHFFEPEDLAEPHPGFPDEPWLDPDDEKIMKIMANRMDMAKRIGCDGVELDNVDAFVHDTSFDVTKEEQLRFIKILANEAHERNLTVALKNAIEFMGDTVDYFDLAINEQCFEYTHPELDAMGQPTSRTFTECTYYDKMTDAGKPVFGAEYREVLITDPVERERMCVEARGMNLRTLVLPYELDGSFRWSCDDGRWEGTPPANANPAPEPGARADD